MLLWQYLVQEAHAKRIDRNEDAALKWVCESLPHLTFEGREAGKVVCDGKLFNWGDEWLEWQRNLRVLIWLAKQREKPPESRSPEDRFPPWVQEAVDDVLSRTYFRLGSYYLSECRRLEVVLTDRKGNAAGDFYLKEQFDDLSVFWQAAFLSFFQPDAVITASICQECGRPLPPTRKGKKPSKATYCKKCAPQVWARENPEKIRASWREAKARERSGK
jgi:hypothetical protein